MEDYDLLALMDTWKAMKASGIKGLPTSFTEALTGIKPIDQGPISIPQITQGNTTYEEGIGEVERRDKEANYITNELGIGESRTGLKHMSRFLPGDRKPRQAHQEAMDHKKRLDVRRELGYDK